MTLPPLNSEQQNVVNYLNRSTEHVFITGRAGTGKSHVIHWFQRLATKKIAVCAPTGIAAVNAGGSTVHNLMALRTSLPADLHVDFKNIAAARKNLADVEAIVLDEVSMCSSAMLDAIDRQLRRIRETPTTPFGGIQMIFVGDLYQLPPVVATDDRKYYNDQDYKSEWFFHAHVWEETEFKTFALQHIQRQSDEAFKEILNAVREGLVTDKQLKEINAVGSRKPPRNEKVLLLGARRKMVADHNAENLRRLKGKAIEFTARVNSGFGIQEPADRKLYLKPNAQVMMINNDRQERWVNGTMGQVKNINGDEVYVEIDGMTHVVGFNSWVKAGYPPEDYKLAPKFHQIPMRTAWGVTVHKSQGLSLPVINVDMGTGAFSPGQTDVALSRVTSPEGLYLRTPLGRYDIKVDPHVKRFFQNLES